MQTLAPYPFNSDNPNLIQQIKMWELEEGETAAVCLAVVLCTLTFAVMLYNIVCVVWK